MRMSSTNSAFRSFPPLGMALVAGALIVATAAAPALAQTASTAPKPVPAGAAAKTSGPSLPKANGPSLDVPPEYVIGPQDVLGINFWRDADMTGDVTVRPDGRITLPLIGDLTAAGMTPEGLKTAIHAAASKLIEDPAITVIVRQINSRKVFITGQVTTPGAHVLTGPLTVMQLISLAGGLTEFAKKKDITVMRTDASGKQVVLPFNYSDVAKGKSLSQNVVLKPGDTVVVP
jgi:polysaccharide export outer membrane protein